MTIPDGERGKPTVYRITDARKGITEDVNERQRRYLISMGIRTVCFVLALVTSGWVRWTMIVAALLLPYIAVIIANAGREQAPAPLDTDLHDDPPSLPSGHSEDPPTA